MSQQSSNLSAQDSNIIRKANLSQVNLQRIKIQPISTGISSPISEQIYPMPSTNSRLTVLSALRSKRNSEISSINDNYFNPPPPIRYENSYRLGPDENQKFNLTTIKKLVSEILDKHLQNAKYDPVKSKEMTRFLCDEIKAKIKAIVYKRYKIIVNVAIGQSLGQSLVMTSRSLWNTETDTHCTIEYSNNTLYAIVTVFAAYYE